MSWNPDTLFDLSLAIDPSDMNQWACTNRWINHLVESEAFCKMYARRWGLRHDETAEYASNSNEFITFAQRSYKRGRLHGSCTNYETRARQLVSEENYWYGLRHGKVRWRPFHNPERPFNETHWKYGVKHGHEVKYTYNSRKQMSLNWSNGKKHGVCRTYERDGIGHDAITYKRGKRHGKAIYWRGRRRYRLIHWNRSVKDGMEIIYNARGKPRQEIIWENGKDVSIRVIS